MAQRCYTADRTFCSAFMIIATLRIAVGQGSRLTRPRSVGDYADQRGG